MSEIIKEENKATIKLDNDMVASTAESIKKELTSMIADTTGGITIDFSGVEMVDSVGIGIIIATYNTIKDAKRPFEVVNVSKDIFALFKTMRLNKHFTVEQA